MDAKPQRPLRALRMHHDENAIMNNPIAAGGVKSLHHNRNKSSPSLLGMMKDGVKRTALNDKPSFANRALAREDVNAGGKFMLNAAAGEKSMVQPLQKKINALNQPAQRPLGIATLKDKTNLDLQSAQLVPLKNGGDENQKPLQAAATNKSLSRRNTMANFKEFSDAPVDRPSLNAHKALPSTTNPLPLTTTSTTSILPNTSAPLAPVHRDLNTKPSKRVLKKVDEELSTVRETSSTTTIDDANMIRKPSLEPIPSTGISLIESICGGQMTYVADEKTSLIDQLVPFPYGAKHDSGKFVPITSASIIGPFSTMINSESTLASTNALLTELVAAQDAKLDPVQPLTTTGRVSLHTITNKDGTIENVEYWDEGSEPENFDDDGFVTARSFKSTNTRGDGNTTGNATIVLVPKMNAKIRKELETAAKLIESMKTVEDIEDEAWDTTMVAEYGDEIFQHMKHLETHMSPNPYYMDNQTEIQWSMRSVLMDWLVQVHLRFNLLPETLFLTVNYIDRFLSSKIVSLGKLQLVGATAIFVAAKYEEITCPSVNEIVYMVDNGYTIDEILKAERFMLSMLQFELGWPGPMSFLRKISKADDYDLETRTLAKYFLEITIMDERFIGSPPSYVAAGAHCLARMMLRKGNWTQAHVYYSNYTYSQIHPLITLMLECCHKPREHHNAIWEKYADRRFKRASHFVQGEMRARFWVPSIGDHAALVLDRELAGLGWQERR